MVKYCGVGLDVVGYLPVRFSEDKLYLVLCSCVELCTVKMGNVTVRTYNVYNSH